jgi:hypothetical protein
VSTHHPGIVLYVHHLLSPWRIYPCIHFTCLSLSLIPLPMLFPILFVIGFLLQGSFLCVLIHTLLDYLWICRYTHFMITTVASFISMCSVLYVCGLSMISLCYVVNKEIIGLYQLYRLVFCYHKQSSSSEALA